MLIHSLIFVLAALLSLTSPARAQNAEKASLKLVRRGVALRVQGKDLEALQLFQQAQAMAPNPIALAQLAQAEQALGNWAKAQADLREALGQPSPWIDQHRATLTQVLSEIGQHVGSVALSCDAKGASVSLNGVLIGETPLDPIPVNAGDVRLVVSAKGYEDVSRSLVVDGGKVTAVSVEVVPLSTTRVEASPRVEPTATAAAHFAPKAEAVAPMAVAQIVHIDRVPDSFELVSAAYAIDGKPLESADAGGPHGRGVLRRGTAQVVPGRHTLTVKLVYRPTGRRLFAYLRQYTFKVNSKHTFTAPPSKLARVILTTYDNNDPLRSYKDRFVVSYRVELTRASPSGE